ncbi:TraR/DksA family transcriptional regulator [Sinisalibacter aestuarii]|uniref:Molecular chaperone DnaK n=1 Tax=Sinisalibacter aestuarii TaxID=2949426 RepID=A0ABQ5LUV0_9RHOB|nr:TraR/DksA C4-type zinc finger protein [Sinisalibacter aestuarii]GKY88744.1 molecular chaperone DnaK [Sinisalibacter aestuarii]
MDQEKRAGYRARLAAMLAGLDTEDALGAEGQKTVELDQGAVGRLSRMDALQGQAMAHATQARRAATRQRIAAALARMDEGEFGYCTECGEEIAPGRLDFDPAIPTCISCAQG